MRRAVAAGADTIEHGYGGTAAIFASMRKANVAFCPTLAAAAFAAGLVDEVRLIAVPVSVGGGTPALPAGQRLHLDLLDERRFANGTVALHYAVLRGD